MKFWKHCLLRIQHPAEKKYRTGGMLPNEKNMRPVGVGAGQNRQTANKHRFKNKRKHETSQILDYICMLGIL